MEHGHFINEIHSEYKPNNKIEIDNFYDIFCKYFDDPILKKVKDDEHFSVYMTRINCLLIGVCRYVLVNVPKDGLPVGTEKKLSTMGWAVLQTRTLGGKINCTNSSYKPKTEEIFESQLSIIKRTKKYSEYNCENIPIKVNIFHKKNEEFEYPNNGKLNSAIEIYNTAISRL